MWYAILLVHLWLCLACLPFLFIFRMGLREWFEACMRGSSPPCGAMRMPQSLEIIEMNASYNKPV